MSGRVEAAPDRKTSCHERYLVAVYVTNGARVSIYSTLDKLHVFSCPCRTLLTVSLYDGIFVPVSSCSLYLYVSPPNMLLSVIRVCRYALLFRCSCVLASQGPRQRAKAQCCLYKYSNSRTVTQKRAFIENTNHIGTTSKWHAHSQSPNRSGIARGASRLQPYSTMQIQLDTTRIHIAISDRPI